MVLGTQQPGKNDAEKRNLPVQEYPIESRTQGNIEKEAKVAILEHIQNIFLA